MYVNAKTSCLNCDTGRFGSSNGICLECPSGFYQDTKGRKECAKCKLGEMYINAKTSCSGCDLGKYGIKLLN